jgi:glycosyltransferase involved in cell wall biosynthesis
MLSRLLVSKGVREYIEAARALRELYPNAQVRLAGQEDRGSGGVPMAEIMAAHREGVIQYLGFVEDVERAISESSVCVLPSWHEGTPHSVLESMAMGRPVITTRVRGCRQTVIHEKTGLLVPRGDITALAAAMATLATDHELRASMGHAGRLLVEQKFDARDVAAMMLRAMVL